MLSLYNTLTKQIEPFQPQNPEHPTMYVCGVTVYDYCHLGHARAFIVFDMLFRWLKHLYPQVTYIRNITDIDDKIINRAHTLGCSTEALCAQYIDALNEDTAALGTLPPTHEPRATEYIDAVITHINALITAGHAYQNGEGDVCYAVNTFADYGKLSGKKIEDLLAGQRVAINTAKKHPFDFVLWKSAKPGEPQWESPFGAGRPGWHIECTCMSHHISGHTLDIHGGGLDLQFPHHENEIAQGEPIFGAPYARYWIHNGFVTVAHEKMSKSLGNFVTIRDILAQEHPETIRLFILRTDYRKPLNYDSRYLRETAQALSGLYRATENIDKTTAQQTSIDWSHPQAQRFQAAMNNNLSSPEAIAILFELAKQSHKTQSTHDALLLKQLAGLLGLLQSDSDAFHRPTTADGTEETRWIEAALQERQAAKKQKDYATADRIRQRLLDQGIVIEDTPQGSTWRRT